MRYQLYTFLLLALAACSQPPATTSTPAAALPDTPSPRVATGAKAADSVATQALTLAQLPAALRPAGSLLEAWRWTDANGENVLVASRTTSQLLEDMRTARLLVRQYVRQGSGYQQLWQLQDNVTNCPLDLSLGLLPGSTRISDLDGDGRTETTVLYALACRGGVDPAGLKLIMHEGAAKYALRGSAIQPKVEPEQEGAIKQKIAGPVCCAEGIPDSAYEQLEGLYDSEKDFTNAPPAFLKFAQQHWRQWRTRADDGTDVH